MNAEASALVIDLAKELIEMLSAQYEKWSEGYFRFCLEESRLGSNGSYVHESGVDLIDPFRSATFFDAMNLKSAKLFKVLGKSKGVLLLSVTSEFQYDIQFDFENLDRWRISKVGGGNGFPANV
ncbi:hypothetical protein GR157_17525 [Burkholderia sp. 4701]|nr:hypothetical protein [Burkholderia sp. 4701]MXN83632.1 hypothetical protein [Burkholderia sp. 4812]